MVWRHVAPALLAASLALGCSEGPRTAKRSSTTDDLAARSGYRFEGTPSVLFADVSRPDGPRRTAFVVTVRLNRAMPRTRQGVRGEIELDGALPEVRISTVSKQRHCYTAPISATPGVRRSLRTPVDGQRMVVAALIRRQPVARVTVTAQRTNYSGLYNDGKQRSRYRAMGCR